MKYDIYKLFTSIAMMLQLTMIKIYFLLFIFMCGNALKPHHTFRRRTFQEGHNGFKSFINYHRQYSTIHNPFVSSEAQTHTSAMFDKDKTWTCNLRSKCQIANHYTKVQFASFHSCGFMYYFRSRESTKKWVLVV